MGRCSTLFQSIEIHLVSMIIGGNSAFNKGIWDNGETDRGFFPGNNEDFFTPLSLRSALS